MIHRLNPNINTSWAYYPEWERRVVAFNQRYLSEVTPAQMAAICTTLRQRWINDPSAAGYWLAFKDGQPVGHVCGWLAVDWNQPYAFIYQAETAPGFTKGWALELDDWVAEMNGVLTARGGPLVSYVEFATFNDAAAMKRLLEMAGRTNLRSRAVLRFDV